MKYKNYDYDFESFHVIHPNEIENYKDCVLLEVVHDGEIEAIYQSIGTCGNSPVMGSASIAIQRIRFLLGRTKAGEVLYGNKNSNK